MFATAIAYCLNDPNTQFTDCFKLGLLNLPDLVWSGIIASAITLLGVFVTNWSFGRRAKTQLKHDARQNSDQLAHERTENDKDRKTEVRQEVYLEAIGEMLKAGVTLTALPLNRKSDVATDFQQLFISFSRILLVCEQETAMLVMDINAAFGKTVMLAQREILPVLSHRSDMDIYEKLREQYRSEQARILAAMAAYNEGPVKPPGVFDTLTNSYEFNTQELHKHEGLRMASNVKFQLAMETYERFVIEQLCEVAPLQVGVISELRKELLLETDNDAFLKKMNANRQEMKEEMEKIFDAARPKV